MRIHLQIGHPLDISQRLRPGLVKGRWSKEEDQTIIACIKVGITKWYEIAERIPGRIGKQIRERWFNQLDPSIKKGGWTKEEDRILMGAQARMGLCKCSPCLPHFLFLLWCGVAWCVVVCYVGLI